MKYDISKVKKGIETFTSISALFSFGGISFGLSKKILEIAKEKVNKNEMVRSGRSLFSLKKKKKDKEGGKIQYNNRSYKLRTGPRGGKFIMTGGKKVYMR